MRMYFSLSRTDTTNPDIMVIKIYVNRLISLVRESQIPVLKTLAVMLITDIYLKQLHRKVSSKGIEK